MGLRRLMEEAATPCSSIQSEKRRSNFNTLARVRQKEKRLEFSASNENLNGSVFRHSRLARPKSPRVRRADCFPKIIPHGTAFQGVSR